MRDDPDKLQQLLSKLQPPEPPSALEARVLRGAREALAREAERDIWTRIWESRPLRLAWGISVSVLVICNVALGELRAGRRGPATPPPGSVHEGYRELTAVERLPRLDEDAQPLLGMGVYRLVEQPESQPVAPAKGKGKESAS
jgi:hypothetical protein